MSETLTHIDSLIYSETGTTSPEAFEKWQARALQESVAGTASLSQFYTGRLQTSSLCGEKSLNAAHLPFTTAEDVLNCANDILSVPLSRVSRFLTMPTSGTSGEAKRLYFLEEEMAATIRFFKEGMKPMTSGGILAVYLGDDRPNTVGSLLREALKDTREKVIVSGFVGDVKRAAEDARGAECLIGMPVQLLALARFAPFLRPESVLLSADYVPQGIVSRLEAIWHCRVYGHYGMTETAYGLAVQCAKRDLYHVRANHFYLEAVDPKTGTRLEKGKKGEIVLTTLSERAMPLVRYRTGDIASLADRPCACGSRLPCMERPLGRLTAGERSLQHILDDILFKNDAIDDFRFALEEKAGSQPLLTVSAVLDRDLSQTDRSDISGEIYQKTRLKTRIDAVPAAGRSAASKRSG